MQGSARGDRHEYLRCPPLEEPFPKLVVADRLTEASGAPAAGEVQGGGVGPFRVMDGDESQPATTTVTFPAAFRGHLLEQAAVGQAHFGADGGFFDIRP